MKRIAILLFLIPLLGCEAPVEFEGAGAGLSASEGPVQVADAGTSPPRCIVIANGAFLDCRNRGGSFSLCRSIWCAACKACREEQPNDGSCGLCSESGTAEATGLEHESQTLD